MRLTPLDLRRAQFSAAVRGFNRAEVASFLTEAADDLELALVTAERARQEVSALQAQLAESPARDTALAAQRASSEVREAAKREAELIVREAREQADEVVRVARARCLTVERALTALGHRKRDAEKSLEESIATLRAALDEVRRLDRGPNSVDNVHEHHPRSTITAAAAAGATDLPVLRRMTAVGPTSSA